MMCMLGASVLPPQHIPQSWLQNLGLSKGFGAAQGSHTCLGSQWPLLHSSTVQTWSLVADVSKWAKLHATRIYIPFPRV